MSVQVCPGLAAFCKLTGFSWIPTPTLAWALAGKVTNAPITITANENAEAAQRIGPMAYHSSSAVINVNKCIGHHTLDSLLAMRKWPVWLGSPLWDLFPSPRNRPGRALLVPASLIGRAAGTASSTSAGTRASASFR